MAKTLDRFDLMRLFIRTAETGSLSAAARALHLSQPSASRQLRTLEADLGVALMSRSTQETVLTEAGREFLADARALLADWEGARDRARGATAALEGLVRVAAPLGLGQTLLADLAADFQARHPGLRFDWRLSDAPQNLVADGIDLWLRIGPLRDETLIARPLARLERLLVARRGAVEAERPTDLAETPAVQLSPYFDAEIPLEGPNGESAVLRPRVATATDNLFAAARWVRAGRGYAALPRWLVAADLAAGSLTELCPGWRPPPAPLTLAYPTARFRPARVRAVIAHLRETVPAALADPAAAAPLFSPSQQI